MTQSSFVAKIIEFPQKTESYTCPGLNDVEAEYLRDFIAAGGYSRDELTKFIEITERLELNVFRHVLFSAWAWGLK